MVHETKHEDVVGYVDEFIVSETTYARGWAFHSKEKKPLPLRIMNDNQTTLIETTQRDDVSTYYKNPEVNQCGWSFKISNSLPCDLQMKINNKWETVFKFNEEIPTPELTKTIPTFLVIDNFYKEPDEVRKFALECEFIEHPKFHKGRRTDKCYKFPGLKERFEQLIGRKIKSWEKYGTNCCFQYCIAGDQLVYHHDLQEYAGVLYLTPDAPPQTGTNLYRSKHTKKMNVSDEEHSIVFKNGYLDSTEFDLVDVVGNVYNRLILFNAQTIHAAATYFGTTKENGRLFQLFFFDLE